MTELEKIKVANPEFFRIASRFGDTGYKLKRRGGLTLLQVTTRFGTPVYQVNPKTFVLTFAHDDQPARRRL